MSSTPLGNAPSSGPGPFYEFDDKLLGNLFKRLRGLKKLHEVRKIKRHNLQGRVCQRIGDVRETIARLLANPEVNEMPVRKEKMFRDIVAVEPATGRTRPSLKKLTLDRAEDKRNRKMKRNEVEVARQELARKKAYHEKIRALTEKRTKVPREPNFLGAKKGGGVKPPGSKELRSRLNDEIKAFFTDPAEHACVRGPAVTRFPTGKIVNLSCGTCITCRQKASECKEGLSVPAQKNRHCSEGVRVPASLKKKSYQSTPTENNGRHSQNAKSVGIPEFPATELPEYSDLEEVPLGTIEATIELLARQLDNIRNGEAKLGKGVDPEVEEDRLCRLLYQHVQRGCGIPDVDIESTYEKSEWDDRVETFFGSMNSYSRDPVSIGNRVFDPENPRDASILFSLYLARKCLVMSPSAKIPKALKSFRERVTDSTDLTTPDTDRALRFFKLLIDDVLSPQRIGRKAKDKQIYCPTSSKASREIPREKGGKREGFYQLPGQYSRRRTRSVKPKAIKTGGKIRTITIDSYHDLEFAQWNEILSYCIRQEKWCVFGKTVEAFMKDRPDFADEGWWTSGDLESATDLFNGDFARAVFDLLRDRAKQGERGITEEQWQRMRSITTDAILEFTRNSVDQQVRGQLMGSLLSFPILCLVSLTAWAVGEGKSEAYLAEPCKKMRNQMRDQWRVGVNGDDIFFPGTGVGWAKGVEAVGGRISRGKSLRSKRYFTVNSELWSRPEDSGLFSKAPIFRPSLLLSYLGGTRIQAQLDSFLEFLEHPLELNNPTWDAIWMIILRRSRVTAPVSLGGLGLPSYPQTSHLQYEFSPSSTREALSRLLVPSPPVRPRSRWSPLQLLSREHDDETAVWLAIPNAKAPELRRRIRKDYVGLPEWTAPKKAKVNLSDEACLLWFQRSMLMEVNGFRMIKVPSRFLKSAKALGATHIPMVQSDSPVEEETPQNVLEAIRTQELSTLAALRTKNLFASEGTGTITLEELKRINALEEKWLPDETS